MSGVNQGGEKSMAEIIKQEAGILAADQGNKNLLEATENMLTDIRSIASDKQVRSVPIASLTALGGSAASLSPALRTVTETTTVNAKGLYMLANESVGDNMK